MAAQPGGRAAAPGRLALVQDFINTNDIEDGADALATPARARAWLAEHGLAPPSLRLSEAEREQLCSVREALRAVCVAHGGGSVDREALRVLNVAARDAAFALQFDERASPELALTARGLAAAIGEILTVVLDAERAGTWQRMKACAEHGCRWAFYDHSRNRSSNWCSMSICGSRNKMRAYRRRQRSQQARRGAART